MAEIKNKKQLSGILTLQFKNSNGFALFCEKHFSGFTSDAYEPVALRVLHGKETVFTLYAVSKLKKSATNGEGLPVKKFKSGAIAPFSVFEFIDGFNFTLSTGQFSLSELRITNK
jgi:hypothetical protein